MNVLEQLEADLKTAAKMRDELRLSVLRMLKAALQNQQIEVGHELSMPEVLAVLQKEAKKRQDSVTAYDQAGRTDLADQEKSEAKMIEQYLPQQLSDDELKTMIGSAITATGATSKADMGRVMAAVMAQTEGRADGRRVSTLVAEQLN